MKESRSYGIIPLMQKDGQRYTILVQLSSGGHRWFPKWHPNPWESIVDTMTREVQEETWLDIERKSINRELVLIEEYVFLTKKKKKKVHKVVTFYTAEIPYVDISQIHGYSEGDGEILAKKTVLLRDACDIVSYAATRENITKLLKTHHSLPN